MPEDPLSEEHVSFLSEFLNPVYLQARTMKALASRFVEESSLELHSFLCAPLADKLRTALVEKDDQEGLGPKRATRIPPHAAGSQGAWQLRGPPHKWRYGTLRPLEGGGPKMAVSPRWAHADVDDVVRSLQDELYPSTAFRAWLACVSKLLPVRHSEEARRFRPGLDYTLATSEAAEARLDVVLGLTPQVEPPQDEGSGSDREEAVPVGWQTGEWGGWEVGFVAAFVGPWYLTYCSVFNSATWLLTRRKTILRSTVPGPERKRTGLMAPTDMGSPRRKSWKTSRRTRTMTTRTTVHC